MTEHAPKPHSKDYYQDRIDKYVLPEYKHFGSFGRLVSQIEDHLKDRRELQRMLQAGTVDKSLISLLSNDERRRRKFAAMLALDQVAKQIPGYEKLSDGAKLTAVSIRILTMEHGQAADLEDGEDF